MTGSPMANEQERYIESSHTCHIPVMGTGFTIDTPLKVARYGLESTISLVDDELVEQMRRLHSTANGLTYKPISRKEQDHRARRITAYLDLIHQLVDRQLASLKSSCFGPGSEISRYFELLPDCPLRTQYQQMLATQDPDEKGRMQDELHKGIVRGRINANIMTKLNHLPSWQGKPQPFEFSDSLAAVRGLAASSLDCGLVLSAGLNQRLFAYMGQLEQFFPAGDNPPSKRVIVKVSDFRSALIQGKLLAKRGIWVAEYRVESGINCGGHAFIDKGQLMGPVLQQFRENLPQMETELRVILSSALTKAGRPSGWNPPPIRISTQGGIGTSEEARMLRQYYGVHSTGWGTPFLLVPEVTNLEPTEREKLCTAGDGDVYLSDSSPLGIPFWNMRNSTSELAREARIASARPGSACRKGHAAMNTEFSGDPLCISSRRYQQKKLASIARSGLSDEQQQAAISEVLVKSCICHDLAGSATRQYGIDERATPAICCGPGIADFSAIMPLDRMFDHVYGRNSLLMNLKKRPHMFIREMKLYLDFLREQAAGGRARQLGSEAIEAILSNLAEGVEYYRGIAESLLARKSRQFLHELDKIAAGVRKLQSVTAECGSQ